ncbi:hypothetical protein [Thermoflavimicrobium dichotomicum]|uniref:Uncharacterized protein n=1 Tax=Thermoflavimicrobium dichotomicum TaxID=46223 RepID=A0A1I3T3T0_9BACL|nr:hypothetical protein [Thermoflavimicrobium dichotomicum]SFJ64326.1 hypothetical protein SAMN05421852_1159 [Thermoflavimicrobium dichotomicum]
MLKYKELFNQLISTFAKTYPTYKEKHGEKQAKLLYARAIQKNLLFLYEKELEAMSKEEREIDLSQLKKVKLDEFSKWLDQNSNQIKEILGEKMSKELLLEVLKDAFALHFTQVIKDYLEREKN